MPRCFTRCQVVGPSQHLAAATQRSGGGVRLRGAQQCWVRMGGGRLHRAPEGCRAPRSPIRLKMRSQCSASEDDPSSRLWGRTRVGLTALSRSQKGRGLLARSRALRARFRAGDSPAPGLGPADRRLGPKNPSTAVGRGERAREHPKRTRPALAHASLE